MHYTIYADTHICAFTKFALVTKDGCMHTAMHSPAGVYLPDDIPSIIMHNGVSN